MRRYLPLFASLLCLPLFSSGAAEHKQTFQWGVNALTLTSGCNAAPTTDELLTNRLAAVALNRFYRAGGENAPVAPTECRIAYNAENLFVVFRCTENDMAFPAMDSRANWLSLLHSPSEQDAAFPDKVDFFVAPDLEQPAFYQFAVTLDGRSFGVKRGTGLQPASMEDAAVVPTNNAVKVTAFEATTVRKEKEWIVFLRIPWKTLGGKPSSSFGFMPVRTRWRDAEVTSPVAVDFPDRAPLDLFIEAHFPGTTAATPPVPSAPSSCLFQLPSGTWRWQRPALLTYPAPDTVSRIWRLEQSLTLPTTPSNLGERILLTQRWADLLTLEGFNFLPTSGSIVGEELSPFIIRRHVNRAMRRHEMTRACGLLDAYLAKLDQVSRKWFADESPGDIALKEWEALSECTGIEPQDRVLCLHCRAGNHAVDLHLALPEFGGVRLYADTEGYFKPAELLPLNLAGGHGRLSLAMADGGRVQIEQKPLRLSFRDATGKIVTRIDAGNVAFRFNPAGRMVGVDFRNRLEADEVIFGFGEKFDRFNQNGNVLTLWGMDDWSGMTVGLRNESYKPVPVFHSSKGYTVFDNSSYRLRADIGCAHPGIYRITQPGPVFDYYFWMAPPERALQSYTALTGRPLLPPKWAFEPWMGRTGRGWNNSPAHDAVAEQERVVKRFAELDIPHSALYAEGGGADTQALYDFLAPRGIKVLSWYYSSIPQSTQAKLMSGNGPDVLAVLNTGAENPSAKEIGYVDFTNPNALEVSRRWWQGRLNLGVAGSMVDFGDRVPEGAVFHNGKSGAEMHNFYSYDYQRTYNEVFHEKRGDDFILFGRAAAPGTQRWAGQFAGDHRANFVGLQAVLTGAMNLCACGFSTWGSDLGGFLGSPEPAVYMRWTEFACFSPLMRSHGRTPREPWEYGASALANYKHYAWVRENLLDYLYHAAVVAHETGVPIMRALPVAFPQAPALAGVGDEYMFGEALLVAPITNEENGRGISFPPGHWTSLWDGKVVAGPATVKIEAPLETIPVYLRGGAVLPVKLNADLQFGDSLTQGSLNALIVTPPKASEEAAWLNSKNEKVSASLHALPGGFAITMTNLADATCLLIYDAPIAVIKADGIALPKLSATGFASPAQGWARDLEMNRTIVHLPHRSTDNEAAPTRIEVEFEVGFARR